MPMLALLASLWCVLQRRRLALVLVLASAGFIGAASADTSLGPTALPVCVGCGQLSAFSPAGSTKLALAAVFSSQTPGSAATLPAWMSGARSSVTYAQTSGSTMAAGTVASGSLAIACSGGPATCGVKVERGTTNMFAAPSNWTSASWTTGSTITGGVTGPDGAASAFHVVVGAGSNGLYQDLGNNGSFPLYWASAWLQPNASTTWCGLIYTGLYTWSGGTGSLASSWARYAWNNGALAQGTNDVIFGRTAGGTGAPSGCTLAEDFDGTFAQAESQPYPTTYTDTTPRAPERLYSSSAASVVIGGRLRAEIAFTPIYSTSQLGQGTDAYPNRRFWTLSTTDFCELDGTHLQVRCMVGGTPSVLPVQVSWSAGDQIVLHLEAGNGVASGWYTDNGVSQVSLGSDGAVQPFLDPQDAALDWGCDATSGTAGSQLDAYIGSIKVFSKGNASPPGTTLYASTSGSGSTCSKASPCSLTGAQTKAQSLGPGTRVLLRAGTYYLGSTLALSTADSGTTYQAYPRETAVLSGATQLSGTWTQVGSSSIWQLSGVSGPFDQLVVNGVRGQRGYHTITPTEQSSWAYTVSGFTAPDSTIAGYARPQDVRIHVVGTYQHAIVPITSAVGTALTANAVAFANMSSVCVRFACSFEQAWLFFYDNAYELLSNPGDWYWNSSSGVLSYYKRGTDTMSTATVEAASLDNVVTIGGSIGSPATNIALRGSITVEGSNWHGSSSPLAIGYASVGSGATGSYTSPSNYPASSYDEQPAAISVTYATGVRLAGITVRRTSAAGIALRQGTQSSTVEGCNVTGTGGVGGWDGEVAYSFSTGADSRVYVTGNTWRRNAFTSTGTCATCYVDSAGLWQGYAIGETIAQNTVNATGLVGIALASPAVSPTTHGGGSVAGNLISGACTGYGVWGGTCDAGMLHTGGGFSPGTTLSGNCVQFNSGHSNVSYYLDNNTSGLDLTGNVSNPTSTYSTAYWLLMQYQGGLASTGNTVVGNYAGASQQESDGSGNTISGNVLATPLGSTALGICASAGM